MNSGDSLATQDSVSRGCGRGFKKGKVRSSAFAPRKIDENCLSVDWVECAFADPDQRCIEGTIRRQGDLLKKIRPQKLSILNVGEVINIVVIGISLDVIYFPTGMGKKRNRCHCRITGMTGGPSDQDFQQKLANLANRSRLVELPALF